MIPLLAVPAVGTLAYKAYKYGSKTYSSFDKIKNQAKFSKVVNNVGRNKFSNTSSNSLRDTIIGGVAGGVAFGTADAIVSSFMDSEEGKTHLDTINQSINDANVELSKPIDTNNSNLLSVLRDSNEKLVNAVMMSNQSLSHQIDLQSALNYEQHLREFELNRVTKLAELDLKATLADKTVANYETYEIRSHQWYSFEEGKIVDANGNITWIDYPEFSGNFLTEKVETTSPTVTVNSTATLSDTAMNGVTTSIDNLATNLTPQKDYYSYMNTPKTINDLDNNAVMVGSPRDAKAIKDASVARKTTDENNFELEDEDFDMWDSIPLMTFLVPESYSYVQNGTYTTP